jgi:dihydrofolate reductase
MNPAAKRKSACEGTAMARLICTGITSLDGYIADENGKFNWSAPDEDVHAFVNDLERPIGTYLYGRSLYEVMVYWENALKGAISGTKVLVSHTACLATTSGRSAGRA